MIELCAKCGRTRPDYIADPTCPEGGYCHWQPQSKAVNRFHNIIRSMGCDYCRKQRWKTEDPIQSLRDGTWHHPSCSEAVDNLQRARSRLDYSETYAQLSAVNAFRDEVAENAKDKGFRAKLVEGLTKEQADGPIGKLVALAVLSINLVGEVSELWEAFRGGKIGQLCDKSARMTALDLPALTSEEEELADIIIRTLDTAEMLNVDIAKALAAKHVYNLTRPKMHGGKLA